MSTIFVLALVVAVISRVVTGEELFAEVRTWAKNRKTRIGIKLAYPLTCGFCFSYWVAAAVVVFAGIEIYGSVLIALFALTAVANVYLIAYERVTIQIRKLRMEVELGQTQNKFVEANLAGE